MGILDDMKKMISPKPTEPVPYERPAKDGRTSTGFVKPRGAASGNVNMNTMLKEVDDEMMGKAPKGK